MADQDYNGDSSANAYAEDHITYAEDGGNETSHGGHQKSGDDNERKIFVGGLSWETTDARLGEYFGKFGKVVETTLKTDNMTGRSRGFGFVLFESQDSVKKVLGQPEHNLDGRKIDPKKAQARGSNLEEVKKIFVGGLDPSIPEETIREIFQQYGKIDEIDLPFDKVKQERRAFCFITFESADSVELVTKQGKVAIGDKEVDVKKATPKGENQGWNQQGGYGGYGGGRGGRGGGGGFQSGGGRGGRGRGRGGQGGQNWNQSSWSGGGGGSQGYGEYPYGDYSQNSSYYDSYGNYGNYYNQWPQGWQSSYNQNGSYGNSYAGYGGYENWYGSGQGGQQQTQQPSSYGKQKTTGQGGGRGGYRPY